MCSMEIVFGIVVLGVLAWLVGNLASGDDTPPPPVRRKRPVRKPRPPRQPKRLPQVEVGETFIGPSYVVDGDTIIVNKMSIRLFGIDAPEIEHPYGINAKWDMFDLCKGQEITVHVTDSDDYGRIVANCYLPDGRDLSAEKVKIGHAIDWPKYSGGIYKHLEVDGIRKKLWRCDARQKGRMPPN